MEYIDFYKNSKTYQILKADIENNMVSHAYMLTGKDSKLLDEFALLICKQIFCNFEDKILCQRIDNRTFPDVKIYPYTDQVKMSKDDVKELIDDSIIYPYEGDRKVYILKNLDSTDAIPQNKLLKTIEEPIQSVCFIITSTLPFKVLPTIRSRCKMLKVEEPAREDIVRYILDCGKDRESAEKIADLSSGSLATVHKLLQDEEFFNMQRTVSSVVKSMNTSADLLFYSVEIMKFQKRLEDVFDEFLATFRDLLVLKSGESVANGRGLEGFEGRFSSKAINEIAKLIVQEKKKIKANCMLNTVVENFLMKILEVRTR